MSDEEFTECGYASKAIYKHIRFAIYNTYDGKIYNIYHI